MKIDIDNSCRGPEVILIAEGHDALQGSLKDLVMTELPHTRVLTVHSGKEAVRLSLACRPSAVILDIDLPELSGIEATRQIHAGLPDMPIVLIHAEESAEYRASAIDAGAGGYVTKQQIADELVPVLKKLLTTGSGKDRGMGG